MELQYIRQSRNQQTTKNMRKKSDTFMSSYSDSYTSSYKILRIIKPPVLVSKSTKQFWSEMALKNGIFEKEQTMLCK